LLHTGEDNPPPKLRILAVKSDNLRLIVMLAACCGGVRCVDY